MLIPSSAEICVGFDCTAVSYACHRGANISAVQAWPLGMSCRKALDRWQSNKAMNPLVCKRALKRIVTELGRFLKSWKPLLVGCNTANISSLLSAPRDVLAPELHLQPVYRRRENLGVGTSTETSPTARCPRLDMRQQTLHLVTQKCRCV